MNTKESAFSPRAITDYFDESIREYYNLSALNFMGFSYTYAELGALVERMTAGLQRIGIKKGMKVGLCLPNCPYYTIFYFAILKAGGVVVNFNPLYVEKELSYQCADSGVKIMVTMDLAQIYNKVEAVRQEGTLDKIIVCPIGKILNFTKNAFLSIFKRKEKAKYERDYCHFTYNDVLDLGTSGAYEKVDIDPENDLALLQYTGGTTGVPKGAMLSHANLSANMEQIKLRLKDVKYGKEKTLAIVPFFHVLGMTAVQNLSIMAGAELILIPRFEINMLLREVNKRKPTIIVAVPTIFSAVINHPKISKYNLTSLKYGISGGAPLPTIVKNDFEQLSGCELVEGYGLSETSPLVTVNPLGAGKSGSIGTAVEWTEVEIRDLENPDQKVSQGKSGEICVRGPQVMQGYWQRPDETQKVFDNDNLLRTGDVGYVDEDGYIFLVDRIKDLIICSGYNVYPRVIEDAIRKNPHVEEVTVIAIPDDYRGQAPKAFIKLKDGHYCSEQDIKKCLKNEISKIEMPKEIEFRDELPKTIVGKLSKKELIDEETRKHIC